MNKVSIFLCAAALTMTVNACSHSTKASKPAQYWQRKDASEQAYVRGPKAQQLLNQHISQCVSELKELDYLNAVNGNPLPDDGHDNKRYTAKRFREALDGDVDYRQGALYVEHLPYQNFESCMVYNGWERVEHVPYDTSVRARDSYLRVTQGDEYVARTKLGEFAPVQEETGSFSNLNE